MEDEVVHVEPQQDGSLRVKNPSQETRFDMGNQKLFGTFNGRGDLMRLLQPEGLYGGRWRLDLQAGGISLAFDEGRAIGRLWELSTNFNGLYVTLNSFLDEKSSTVYQQVELENDSKKAEKVVLTLEMDFRQPLSWWERARSFTARHLPGLLGMQWLWEKGWAKVIHLEEFRGNLKFDEDRFTMQGVQVWTWVTNHTPKDLKIFGKKSRVQFEIDTPAGEKIDLAWVFGEGDEPTVAKKLECIDEIRREVDAYADWLCACSPVDEPNLQSFFVSGLNAAVSMFKQFSDNFAGLLAGPEYAYPPRLYFRDSYWTAQVLLAHRPDLVRKHLLSLGRGVDADGTCPSGVFAPRSIRVGKEPTRPIDWLPNHYDAPAYFVLLLDEYIQTSGDKDFLSVRIEKEGCTVWEAANRALLYLVSRDSDNDGLIEKPYQANDWADNVRRSIWVTYDQVLYVASLFAGVRIANQLSDQLAAKRFQLLAVKANEALNTILWDEEQGHFVNYIRPGYTENHFSIDTLLAVYYNLVEPERARRILQAAQRLQTRQNTDQPYGDWGVMCVFPLYGNADDLFDITAQPYRYHNGADWPYWDGVYAAVLHRYGDPDWNYVLTRWWQYSLEQGWLTPVEYYSPPYPPGGMLQGWSGMPAAVLQRMKTKANS